MVEHKQLVSRVKRQRKSLSSSYRDERIVEPVPNRANFQSRVLGALFSLFCLRGLRTVCPPSFLTAKRKVNLKSRIRILLAVLLPLVLFSVTAQAADDGDLQLCDITVTDSCTVTTDGIGRLEVHHSGDWRGVCDDYFTDDEAEIACKQLKATGGQHSDYMPEFAKTLLKLDGYSHDFWLDDLVCVGDEDKLSECPRAGDPNIPHTDPNYWGNENCRSFEHAGVVCSITAPDPPWDLEAEPGGQSMIVLTWRAPNSYVEGYKIEVSEDGGNNWTDLEGDTGNTDTTYTHSGLSPGDTRHYRVSAINSEGTSQPSNIASATVEGTAPPPVDQPGAVTLSGTLAIDEELTATLTDPDGSITGVEWKWYRSADKSSWNPIPGATSSGSTIATYTPVAESDPAVEDDEGKYLRAVASYTDGHGPNKSEEAESNSKVPEANWTPYFDPDPPPDTFSVNENTVPGENIGTPIMVTDPEDEALTYSLDDVSKTSFDIDSSGQIKTKATLDYEAEDSYTVVVKVTDGNTEIMTTVTINVDNVEEDGTVTLSNYSPQVGIELTATFNGDPDGNVRNLSWQWQKRANGGSWSGIPSATSASYTPGTGDLNHLLRAKASYTDGYGSDMAYEDSNEAVMDTCPQNNAAPMFGGTSAMRSVLENTPSGRNIGASVTATDSDTGHQIRLTYSLGGTDASSFNIDGSSGQIKTRARLDYETKDSYTVEVTVTDPCGATDEIAVAINVSDVDESVSPPSNTKNPSQVTKSTPTTVPNAPSGLMATRGDGEVTLNWRASNNGGSAIKYYEYNVDGGAWISTGGKSTSYTVTGLTNGETYRFRVRAVNSVGPGAESKPAIATPATVPGAPRNLTTTPGDQRVTLIWERPTDNGGLPITSYQYIQKEEDGSFGSWVSIDDSGPRGANETSYTVTGLKNGTIYSFRVRAVNALGPGDPSVEATAEPSTSAFRRARHASLNILPTFGRTMLRNSVDALTWRLDSVLSGSFERTGMFRLMDQHAGLHEVLGNDIWDDPDQWEDLSLEELLYGSSFIIEAGVMLRKPKEHPKEAPKEYKGYTEEDSREHIREYPEEDSADKNMWIDKDEKPMVAERRGGIGFWGKADYNNLSVSSDEWFTWDGQIASGYMGVDRWLNEKVLTGLSVSLTKGDFDYTDTTPGEGGRGDYYVKMLSVSPYVSWFLSDDAYLWGSVGYGRGQVDIDDEDVQSVATSDLSYKSVAAGGSGRLFDVGDTTFSLKSEAFKVWMDVEGDDYLIDELSIGVHQLRLSMEGSYEYRFASGTWFNPLVEVALRHDGGDGETGTGVEVGGGFLYEDPNLGLSVSGRGRWLAAHSSDEFSQWGVGGVVIFDTGADKRGALFSVSPEWGDTSSGVDSLWGRGVEGLSSEDGGANDMHLDAEFGYGLSALGGDGLFTPYSGLRLGGDGRRQYRLGSRLDLGRSTSLSLETDRRQSDTTKPEHGIMLRGKLNF